MKRKALLSLLLLVPVVASCKGAELAPKDSNEYIATINAGSDDFVILQLADIHWTYNTLVEPAKKYLNKVVSEAIKEKGHVDLIELTGDQTFIANKNIATQLYDFIDSFEIPWVFNYGNHDLQGSWSTKWLNDTVYGHKHNVNKFVYDDVAGDTNFVINVKWQDDYKWQIYHIDTKSLTIQNGSYTYDYITDDQVEWYKAQTDKDKGSNPKYTPSLTYCHIPPKEILKIADGEGTILGGVIQENEPYYFPSDIDSAFMKYAEERNCKGVFFGHDHSNDAVWKYKNMAFGYGVKANTELYSTTNEEGKTLTGGSLVTIHKGSESYELMHYYIDANNVDAGIFDKWEVTIA